VYGRIHFPHYTERKKFWCPVNPHENRFEIVDDTLYNSKLIRPPNVLMHKSLI